MLLLNWIFVSGLVSCYYYKHDCMTLLSLTLQYLDKLFLLVAEWHRLLQHCHVVVSERSDRSRHVVVGVGQKLQQVWQLCLDGLLRYPCISLVVALHQSIDNGTKRERHTRSEFARNCSKFFYTQRHTTLDTVWIDTDKRGWGKTNLTQSELPSIEDQSQTDCFIIPANLT